MPCAASFGCVGRWKAIGRENVPADGALIVVSNHLNNTDPPILAAGIARRRIRFMAKIELTSTRSASFPGSTARSPCAGSKPIWARSSTPSESSSQAASSACSPRAPAAVRGTLGTPHPGTALIALRSGATILPCAITGTEQLVNHWPTSASLA